MSDRSLINQAYAGEIDLGDAADAVHRVIAGLDKGELDRKSTRLNSSHTDISRMPSSA